jgi:plastocyanin
VDVAAGAQGSADLSGVAAGTYTVLCTYHPQMKATIEVG